MRAILAQMDFVTKAGEKVMSETFDRGLALGLLAVIAILEACVIVYMIRKCGRVEKEKETMVEARIADIREHLEAQAESARMVETFLRSIAALEEGVRTLTGLVYNNGKAGKR